MKIIKEHKLTILVVLVWMVYGVIFYPDIPVWLVVIAIVSIGLASMSDHRYKINKK